MGSRPSRASCRPSASSSSPRTAPASTSPRTASRSASVSDLTAVPPLVGGQVKTFHPAVYAGILARRDVPEQLERARRARHRPDRPRRRQRQAVRARGRPPPHRPRRGDRDDRRRRRGAPRRRRAQRRRGHRHRRPGALPAACSRSSAIAGPGQRRDARTGWPPRRSARSPRTTPRSPPTSTRSRATSSRSAWRIVLEKVDGPALRREPAPAGRLLPRDHPPARHARRRDAARRARRPSFNNLLDLDAAYRIARDYTAPTVAIVKHTDPVGLASADELVEAYRQALETDPVAVVRRHRRRQPRAGRRDRARDRGQLLRGGRRARVQRRRRSGSCAAKPGLELLAVPPDPTEGMRDYGIANLDFKRVGGGLLVETQDDARTSTAASSRS